jgi:hypothetical protein
LIAVAVIVFALVGASFAGTLPLAFPKAVRDSFFTQPASPGTVLGKGSFLLRGLGAAAPQSQLALLFEFLAVAMAALVPWGSGADRWRLPAGCAWAAVLAALRLSSHGALDLGRRLAGSTGRELRPRRGLPGRLAAQATVHTLSAA